MRCLAFLFALLLAAPSMATSYYVRMGGNDACDGTTDADGSSGACAFRNPQKAWDRIIASGSTGGDVINIHAGTYTTTSVRNCPSSGANGVSSVLCLDGSPTTSTTVKAFTTQVTIQGVTGETATLEGNATTQLCLGIWAIKNVLVQNLSLHNCLGGTSTSYWGIGGQLIAAGGQSAAAVDNVTVQNIAGDAAGICASSGETATILLSATNDAVDHFTIQDSTFTGVGKCYHGIAFRSGSSNRTGWSCLANKMHVVFKNNTFARTVPSGQRSPAIYFYCREMRGVTMDGNYFTDTNGGDGMEHRSCSGMTWINNVLENVGTAFTWRIWGDASDNPGCTPSQDTFEDSIVENNVFVNTSLKSMPAIFFWRDGCDGCTFANNVIKNYSMGYRFEEDAGCSMSGNYPAGSTWQTTRFENVTSQYSTNFGGTRFTDPACQFNGPDTTTATGFTDGASAKPTPYYVPAAGSTLIDSGQDANCSHTILGVHCDIGAYEFNGSPSPITDLAVTQPTIAPQLHQTLTWTAPGGQGESYTIRYSTSAITREGDWTLATSANALVAGMVTSTLHPSAPGTAESFTVVGLKPNTTYYWAVRTTDAVGNVSALSNSPSSTTAKYEGYGALVTGGGDRSIYHVTSLADTGTGTFRDALSAGNRYIVFDVGGTVLLGTPPPTGGGASDPNDTINFTGSNVTIDGSTAPSPGITVYANVNILNDGLRFRDNTNTILTYIRFLGNEPNAPTVTDCTAGFVNEDLLSAWPTSGVGSVQDIVWDHLTIRNVGDSGFDVAGRVVNATFSYNYILWNCHPQTMGTSSDPSSNMTWHHNLWASNGERLPQFSKVHDNMDYRNNILFKWNNSYAIRIRNSPATDKISANFVNNYFFAGTAATNAAIMYGLTTGADAAEENGPGSCTTQGTLYTAGLMGEIYVAGNTFSAANCETYSTVPTERFVPSASQVATDAATSLVSTVLPGVGTIYRRTDEQTEITSVNTALGGPAACGNGVVEGAEVCDDGNTVTETACSYGIPSCTLCNAGCSAPLSLTGQYCGDSVLNGPELCDTGPGYVLTTTCIGLGFSGGTLVCAANCLSYNTSGCSVTPVSATLSGGAILSGGSLP